MIPAIAIEGSDLLVEAHGAPHPQVGQRKIIRQVEVSRAEGDPDECDDERDHHHEDRQGRRPFESAPRSASRVWRHCSCGRHGLPPLQPGLAAGHMLSGHATVPDRWRAHERPGQGPLTASWDRQRTSLRPGMSSDHPPPLGVPDIRWHQSGPLAAGSHVGEMPPAPLDIERIIGLECDEQRLAFGKRQRDLAVPTVEVSRAADLIASVRADQVDGSRLVSKRCLSRPTLGSHST